MEVLIKDLNKLLPPSFRQQAYHFPTVVVLRNQHVYIDGDSAGYVYLIEVGQVKLSAVSREGKECVLAILTQGDIFGEQCLAGSILRQETATAMELTRLKRIPRDKFFLRFGNAVAEDFVRYFARRINDQQRVIASLLTADSEHRLGETLLLLARKLGKPKMQRTLIEKKITHEDLSAMVGTTRPRITAFMLKFRRLGLIEVDASHLMIVREEELAAYLARAT